MQILRKSQSQNPPLSAWGAWKWVIRVSPSRPIGLRGLSWVRDLGFGCWARGYGEWADRPRLFSPSLSRAHEYLYPSPGACDTVSFGLDDILLTAASDSEDFRPALADALPPSGQEARPTAAYSELMDVLSRATEKLSLEWPNEPRESQASKLDERFLSGPNSRPERKKLPFFSDLHQEISRFCKQPFSSCLTNAAAADFTNLVGSVEQGYTAIPVVEDILASHLSPSLAPSWKSRPLLPTKPCRTTSALIGKSYIAAGQAGMALHTEMDGGTGLTPEAVKELRRATDLARPDRKSVSARLKHALLTQICHNHPSRFGVQ